MNKTILLYVIPFLLLALISCSNLKENKVSYEDQIGNTHFNSHSDNPNFRFCDSTNTLHKRAFVKYEGGGMGAIYNDIHQNYVFKPSYKSYSGYFIIRFAVNCNDQAGRFRMQILDPEFNLSNPPEELKNHILSIIKNLKGWKHPVYDGKDYDGYKFLTIKIVDGQIK